MTYGHAFNWAILAGISLAGAIIRHHFNLRSQGHYNVWILPIASVMILAMAFVMRPVTKAPSINAVSVSYSEVETIIQQRCMPCHATKPTMLADAPLGLVFDTYEQVVAVAPKVQLMAVDGITMPPGNITGITSEERELLGQWVASGTPQ